MTRSIHRLRLVVRDRPEQPLGAAQNRWREYEDAKRELAESACSAAEYEAGLRAIAERLGL